MVKHYKVLLPGIDRAFEDSTLPQAMLNPLTCTPEVFKDTLKGMMLREAIDLLHSNPLEQTHVYAKYAIRPATFVPFIGEENFNMYSTDPRNPLKAIIVWCCVEIRKQLEATGNLSPTGAYYLHKHLNLTILVIGEEQLAAVPNTIIYRSS